MLYLFLAIASSVGVSVIMRLSTKKAAGSLTMLSANYLMCIVIAVLFTGFDRLFPHSPNLPDTLWMGGVNGAFYLASFVLYQHSVKRNGMVLSSTFMKLGLLVPIIISVFLFFELPRAYAKALPESAVEGRIIRKAAVAKRRLFLYIRLFLCYTHREGVFAMTHILNLNPQPFAMIADGRKTIELRLWDEKRSQIKVGDTLVFIHTEDAAKTLTAKVTALHRFPDFAALYAALPLDKCGYLPEEMATASPTDMNIYYSAERQAQYGVVGIEITLIEEDNQ